MVPPRIILYGLLTQTDKFELVQYHIYSSSLGARWSCQTDENSHQIAGTASIYALNNWRHSARAAARLSVKLVSETIVQLYLQKDRFRDRFYILEPK